MCKVLGNVTKVFEPAVDMLNQVAAVDTGPSIELIYMKSALAISSSEAQKELR